MHVCIPSFHLNSTSSSYYTLTINYSLFTIIAFLTQKFFVAEFVMTAKGRDFELCSGGEEDEYLEVEVHSPTDSSEDSVEVKVSPICLRNKRKCAEPRKVQDAFTAPPKKRMCFKAKNEIHSNGTENPEPFRPWSIENHRSPSPSPSSKSNVSKEIKVPKDVTVTPNQNFVLPQLAHPTTMPTLLLPPTDYTQQITAHNSLYVRPSSPLEQKPIVRRSPSPAQPLPLVKKNGPVMARERKIKTEMNATKIKIECDATPASSCDPLSLRVPLHPHLANLTTTEAERLLLSSAEAFPNLHPHSRLKNDDQGGSGRKEQRNYKNMTRERRIEANARERTRVHTISAAFETLRRSVPSYSHNQKLSKLSVLRIACSYIMTLSTLVGGSTGVEVNPSSSISECVDNVSKTIQKEGKLRKKKDESE